MSTALEIESEHVWQSRSLGELLDVQNGFAFSSKKFSDTTGVPLIRIRDLKNDGASAVKFDGDYDPSYLVKDGDLLIGMDGEFVCYEWAGGQALLNQRVCRLTNFSAGLEPRFVLYGINKFLREIEDATSFTTVKHLSSKKIKAIEFPLPPLEEQKRIVAVLDQAFAALDRARANAEANLADVEEVFEATLDEAFQNIAGEKVKLGSICGRVTVGHVGKTSPYYRSSGIPFLRTQNVTKNGIYLDEVVYITEEFHRSLKKSSLLPNDVLISRVVTDRMNVGVIPTALGEANCANVICVRPGEAVEAVFLSYLIQAPVSQRELLGQRVGSAQQVVNTTILKNWPVTIPPIEHQRRIVADLNLAFERVSGLKASYRDQLQDLDQLRQSILQKAFAGELT